MRSMTGFGTGIAENNNWRCEISIYSVNHKRLDLHLSLPYFLRNAEQGIRTIITDRIKRGNVTVDIKLYNLSESNSNWRFNTALINQAIQYASTLADNEDKVTYSAVLQALSLPNAIIEEAPTFGDEDRAMVMSVLNKSLDEFIVSSEKEGLHLQEELTQRLNDFRTALHVLKECAPRVQRELEENLRNRLLEFFPAGDYDEKRLLEELVYYINKTSIDEELVRLDSHLNKVSELFQSTEPLGRSCDFYFQEMNREINTSGSKINDAQGSQAVVEMKTILEQMREQIQNVV